MMSLQTTIDEIRDRLERGIFKNEASVRLGIVDELLRELEWPVSDTQIVCPEYSIGGGRVDYALCDPLVRPLVLIEVKNIGNLDSGAKQQLFSYAFHAGVPILVLTDGKQWQFFYPFGQGDYDDRRVCALDLSDSDSKENANVLQRYLSYPSVQNKEAVQTIESDYRLLSSQRDAEKHLPQAWQRLLEGTDGRGDWLIELVEGATESLCGHKPSKEQVLDFLKSLGNPLAFSEPTSLTPPPEPSPQPEKPSKAEKSLKSEKYRSYFQSLIDILREEHAFTNARKGQPENWYHFASGTTGISYGVHFPKDGRTAVYFGISENWFKKSDRLTFFDTLAQHQKEIAAHFDLPLSWERNTKKTWSFIAVYRGGDIEASESELEAIRDWHVEYLLKFKAVFGSELEKVL